DAGGAVGRLHSSANRSDSRHPGKPDRNDRAWGVPFRAALSRVPGAASRGAATLANFAVRLLSDRQPFPRLRGRAAFIGAAVLAGKRGSSRGRPGPRLQLRTDGGRRPGVGARVEPGCLPEADRTRLVTILRGVGALAGSRCAPRRGSPALAPARRSSAARAMGTGPGADAAREAVP